MGLGLAAVAVLVLAGVMLRRQAGGGTCRSQIPLDLAPVVLGWMLFFAILQRPLMAAVLILAIAAGLILADTAKRETLREPLVFADRAELIEVVRHPGLYLPFAGPGLVIGGAAGAAGALALLFWLEPPRHGPPVLLPVVLVAALVLLHTQPPFLAAVARRYRAQAGGMAGDVEADMRRFGFLAVLIVHATLAREERQRRRIAVAARVAPMPQPGRPPVVVLQIESFFDARRLGAAAGSLRLPGFERLAAEAVQRGRLGVPCWGANTVRTEFEVLTGITQAALGLDRFNPYDRFARSRLPSLAWQFKQAGYRTICLHPFDKTFYARHKVMPALGFDEFRGPEFFPNAARTGGWVSDADVAAAILRTLQTDGPGIFVFAITMGNHGPWAGPPAAQLAGYLEGLSHTDAMFAPIMQGLPPGAVLAAYGDHQPSLAAIGDAIGAADTSTDYAVWRHPGTARATLPFPSVDIAASALADVIVRAATCIHQA